MSSSYTISETETFTVTHARYLAAKIATDLKRIQRLYGVPSDDRIAKFEIEATALLKAGYLGFVTYGFQKNGSWIVPTVRYSASSLASDNPADDDPGRVKPGANVDGAIFKSRLAYSNSWNKLSDAEQQKFEADLPFQRTGTPEPGVSGYMADDRTYSAGGQSLSRSSLRSY